MRQADSGLGLEAQIAACRALALARGLEIVGEFSDPALSGRDDVSRRPGLQAVIAAAAKRDDTVVVVYSVSRLARRQRLLWDLLDDRGEHQLRLVSATEAFDVTTPAGKAMLGMLAVWAQLQADMIGEQTAAALAALRARGGRTGPKSLGQKDPERAALVHELHRKGRSQREIAAELNTRGVLSPRGGKWHPTAVARVLGGRS